MEHLTEMLKSGRILKSEMTRLADILSVGQKKEEPRITLKFLAQASTRRMDRKLQQELKGKRSLVLDSAH